MPRLATMTLPPYDSPRLWREIALRVIAGDIASTIRRNERTELPADHPHLLSEAERVLYGGSSARSYREEDAYQEAYHTAWAVYRLLKERGIIGDEFDKEE